MQLVCDCDITVLSGGISMKLGTDMQHESGQCCKCFQGREFRGQGHRATIMEMLWTRQLHLGFELKLKQLLSRTCWVFKVIGSKIKVRQWRPWKYRSRKFCALDCPWFAEGI